MWPIFVYRIICSLLNAVELLVVVRVIGSWIPLTGGTWGKIYGVVFSITEPMLSPLRKLLQRITALRNVPIDFSPIALFLLLAVLQGIARNVLLLFL